MSDERVYDAVRRAIGSLGGSNAAAAACGLAPRTVQRAKAGDATPEIRERIAGAVRPPLWALEALAAGIADGSPRATVRRLHVFFYIARRGVTSAADTCEAIAGDRSDSSVHAHIRALIDLGLIDDLGLSPTDGRGAPTLNVALSDEGWRALGLANHDA